MSTFLSSAKVSLLSRGEQTIVKKGTSLSIRVDTAHKQREKEPKEKIAVSTGHSLSVLFNWQNRRSHQFSERGKSELHRLGSSWHYYSFGPLSSLPIDLKQ
jgi:hypothetical protein